MKGRFPIKLDRLLGILTVLMQTDSVTAPQLAEKFEVNRRTIGRDIDALCRAGIPVVTRQGKGGGISVAEGYRLDKSILTTDELTGIISALKGIGSVSERSETERILDKLRVGEGSALSLREPLIINLASHYKTQLTEKIKAIKSAVLERRIIAFDYCYEKGEVNRVIEPYFAVFQWTSWYVFGFCLERNDWRMFKLTRLNNLRRTGDSYSPREVPERRLDFEDPFPDDRKLTALFDPSVKYQLVESYGPGCCTETEDGLLVEIEFTYEDFILSWLLSFGGKVKVLEPEYIREKVKSEAQKILHMYGN